MQCHFHGFFTLDLPFFTKSEEGEVTFKFEAYQDAKLDGALVSKEYTAKVVPPKATGVKQTAWDTFEVTFEGNIEAGGYYADVKSWETEQAGVANDVYYKVSSIKVPFSSVKKSTPKENVLTVKMYGAFNPGTEYFVDIAGKTFSFVAAGNEAKDVTDLVITTTKATVATTTTIKYKLLNAAGIDITETALPGGSITFSGTPTSTSDYLDTLGTVYFAAVGDSVEVTGTFTYYDPDDNYSAKTTTGKGTIVGVASAATVLVSSEYSISKAAEGWVNSGAGVHTLKMNDAAVLYGKITLKTGDNDPVDYVIGDAMSEYNDAVLSVAVADEHYAMAQGTSGDGGERLDGVNKGRTSVLVFYTNDEGKNVVLTSWAIEVVDARRAASISATAKNATTSTPYLNYAEATDTLKIKVTVKDQYGDDWRTGVAGVTLTERQGTATAANLTAGFAGTTNTDIVIGNADFTGAPASEKSVSYDVKLDGTNLATAVSFKVKDATINAAASNVKYQPVISSTTIDTTLKTSQTYYSGVSGDASAKLVKLVDNYYYGGLEDFTMIPGAPVAAYDGQTYGIGAAATGSAFVARLLRNNSNIVAGNLVNGTNSTTNALGTARANIDDYHRNILLSNNISQTTTAGNMSIDFQVFNTGNKLAAGTYQVSFFKVTKAAVADTRVTVVPLGTVGLTVSDNQAAPTAVQLAQTTTRSIATATATADVLAIVNENYEFWWKGHQYTATNVSFKQNGAELYIYSVAVGVNGGAVGDLYSYDFEESYDIPVTIGELITLVQP